jgi:membrane fusion protein (multidrug efflux system)
MQLGAEVQAGELLLELDSEPQQLARQEKQAKVDAIEARRSAMGNELAAERETLQALQRARERGVAELAAKIAGSELQAKYARVEAERGAKLKETNAISSADLNKLQTAAATSDAALVESRAALDRTQQDRITLEQEQQTRIVRLERQLVELDGEIAVESAALKRIDREILDRRIVAPVGGRLDEVVPVREGSVVTVAQRLAVLVPPGEPHAVAHFPAVVLGRIRTGQRARIRLDGFPWTQYGTVAARVSSIGTEPVDGLIRVELLLLPAPDSAIPIEHGFTGSAEVEVERVAPAVLVLRAAGQFLGTRRTVSSDLQEPP